jgi:large subunit ribosomal protein L21
MSFAIIAHSGKQYRVSEGDIINLDRVELPAGGEVDFPEVLAVKGSEGMILGRPRVENARVTGRVVGHFKDKKVLVFKHKRRKNYRRTRGHRQTYTRVKIENIVNP